MRAGLSFMEFMGAIVITGLLCAPQALAQLPNYMTDMEEPDIMTVKNDYCCHNERLKREANIQLHIEYAVLASVKPVHIQIMNASHEVITEFSTRNKVVYMHLPEGRYTILVNGLMDHRKLDVQASDTTFKDFVL